MSYVRFLRVPWMVFALFVVWATVQTLGAPALAWWQSKSSPFLNRDTTAGWVLTGFSTGRDSVRCRMAIRSDVGPLFALYATGDLSHVLSTSLGFHDESLPRPDTAEVVFADGRPALYGLPNVHPGNGRNFALDARQMREFEERLALAVAQGTPVRLADAPSGSNGWSVAVPAELLNAWAELKRDCLSVIE